MKSECFVMAPHLAFRSCETCGCWKTSAGRIFVVCPVISKSYTWKIKRKVRKMWGCWVRKLDTAEDRKLPGQQYYNLVRLSGLSLVANSLNVPFRVPEWTQLFGVNYNFWFAFYCKNSIVKKLFGMEKWETLSRLIISHTVLFLNILKTRK